MWTQTGAKMEDLKSTNNRALNWPLSGPIMKNYNHYWFRPTLTCNWPLLSFIISDDAFFCTASCVGISPEFPKPGLFAHEMAFFFFEPSSPISSRESSLESLHVNISRLRPTNFHSACKPSCFTTKRMNQFPFQRQCRHRLPPNAVQIRNVGLKNLFLQISLQLAVEYFLRLDSSSVSHRDRMRR